MSADEEGGKSLKALTLLSMKRSYEMFAANRGESVPLDEASQKVKIACKIRNEYGAVRDKVAAGVTRRQVGPEAPPSSKVDSKSETAKMIDSVQAEENTSGAIVAVSGPSSGSTAGQITAVKGHEKTSAAISRRLGSKWPRPSWHAPWKNYRVISSHLGWVRSIAFDPGNEWFATGSADRTIKIWETATGTLKLTLMGHIEQVTGLAVSDRHPYMFSSGLDKKVMCWDLEANKVIRNYHGHLSGVYALRLHPTLDLIMTGGRDSVCRVWDMRTKLQIFCMAGHDNTVCSILTRPTDPQVSCPIGHDATIKLWDLRKNKTMATLTHHKKSVRAMALHALQPTFCSASADNIKKFKLPTGEFLHNTIQKQPTIINAMAVNEDGVMATGGNNGMLWFWDWHSGNCFQETNVIPQPGSLESEAGIFAMAFDVTGSRLVTCEADKTVKMWKEDEEATPETHPVQFKPPRQMRRF